MSRRRTLTAKPRGSRRVSGDPRSWMTVEKRTMTGVWTPGARNRSAQVMFEMSCVTCAWQWAVRDRSCRSAAVVTRGSAWVGAFRPKLHLEEALCRCTPCMNDALGYALAVERGKFLDQMVVFEKDGTPARAQRGYIWVSGASRLSWTKTEDADTRLAPTVSDCWSLYTGAPAFVVR